MGTVARSRHHDLLEKGVDVVMHEISEGRHRPHGPIESRTRHLRGASRDLDEETSGRILGTENGLNSRATLPADRCHLDGAAVGVNCHDGDDAAIHEKYTVQRTIDIQQDLLALTADMFKLRQKLLEIASWQSKQKAIAGPI